MKNEKSSMLDNCNFTSFIFTLVHWHSWCSDRVYYLQIKKKYNT